MSNRHREADRRRRSAVTLIKALLSPDLDLYAAHRRDFLRRALGKLTEAQGRSKYKTRFRSQASLTADPGEWQHEHVFPRARMVDALLASPTRVEEIVAQAVGCIVTQAEHKRLGEVDRTLPDADGWERYRQAGIIVIDTETGLRLDFAERASTLAEGAMMSMTVTGKSDARSRVDEVLEGLAPHRVVIPRSDEVRAYLERHPEGLGLLGPIIARARQEFPEPTQLSLGVYVDPESGEQDLKLYVRQAVYEPGMWSRLLTVCDPFEEALAQMSSGWLHVTTDHRSPQ